MGKRTVSSSVITGAIKPQIRLNKSTFSFIKPIQKLVDVEKISPLTKENIGESSAEKQLAETNRILVEIQNQLALDFGYRITEEKKALAAEKKRISAQKVADKEERIEKGGKGILGKTFDKVTAPFKSIFQKLIDFFSIILTGILLNTAFEWLKDENNRKKLTEFFDFLKEYWQELLIIFAAYKLAKLVGVVAGIALKLKGILKWFKNFRFPRIKPRGPSAAQGATKALQATQRAALKQAKKKSAESVISKGLSAAGREYIDPVTFERKWSGLVDAKESAKLLKKPNILQKGLSAVGGFGDKLKSSLINPIVNVVLPKLPPKVKTEISEAVAKKGLKRFLPYVNVLFGTVEGIQRIMEGDIEGSLLSFASAIPIAGWGALALDIYRSVDPEGYQKNIRFGLSSEEINKAIGEGFGNIGTGMSAAGMSKGGTVSDDKKLIAKLSQGGTVGQGDRPGTDTVPAFSRFGKIMLDAGEEVIRTSSAMLFRPLLKDINDNAGRLWQAFSVATTKQNLNNTIQAELNKKFNQLISQFKELIDGEINRVRKNNTTNRGGPTTSQKINPKKYQESKVSDTPTQSNIPKKYQESKVSDTPTQSNIPNISLMSGEARTSELAQNISNSYTSNVVNNIISPQLNPNKNNIIVLPIPIKNLQRTTQQPKVNIINLPAKTVNLGPKPGSIKTPSSGSATDVPSISPFDASNPYISSNRLAYGMIM